MMIDDDDEVPERVSGWLFDDATERLLAKFPGLGDDYFRDQIMLTPAAERPAFIAQLVRVHQELIKSKLADPEVVPEARLGEIYCHSCGDDARYFEVIDVADREVFVVVLPGFRYRVQSGREVAGPVRGVRLSRPLRARLSNAGELTVFGAKRRLTAMLLK